MQFFSKTLVTISGLICISMASATYASHMSEESINARTSPIGKVHITATETAAAIPTPPREGDVIYNRNCIGCHSTGVANAPKMGDSDRWTALMVAGIDALVSSAKIGKNAMPPMGTCADCSDEELKKAIQFMADIGN